MGLFYSSACASCWQRTEISILLERYFYFIFNKIETGIIVKRTTKMLVSTETGVWNVIWKIWSFEWHMSPWRYCDYHPGALYWSQVTATNLKIEHPQILFAGAQSPNELQRLDYKSDTWLVVPAMANRRHAQLQQNNKSHNLNQRTYSIRRWREVQGCSIVAPFTTDIQKYNRWHN